MLNKFTYAVIGAVFVVMMLAVSSPAPAAKGGGGKGGDGSTNENNFDVAVTDHGLGVSNPPSWEGNPPANLYAPTVPPLFDCIGDTPGGGNNWAFFLPDPQDNPPNECAVVDLYDLGGTDPNGYILYDDVHFSTDQHQGQLLAVYLHGQEAIGRAAKAHESELMPLGENGLGIPAPTEQERLDGFTLHVHAQDVPVWKLSKHLGGKQVEIVGYVSIGDLVYTPQ